MERFHYNSALEALNDLKKRGYTLDFNLEGDCLQCPQAQLQLNPKDFTIDEVYRFEGMSNPADSSVVYGISSKTGQKGVLVDAYGMYANSVSTEMAAKLKSAYH
ncbi:phosphoribosylpyrophosphate synthetase [Adhaeribacter sp. BT258]|uniref:Phosphoribosylpyrophosphate synthetase n=1 Tax=Adhaeribacter terrigena TaxID=2793070 RepID=A0ABS1BXR0_9BACT|nr:phosphoribosylpyrophosphate synthetase [Adhaeribacter terrigena]MBK0401865.1 phosphoribosylpyrophosphate synthetase [Adhaeribacter terrigena]